MSRHPDPCYCEQASAYENLLIQVLAHAALDRPLSKDLVNEIKETIESYEAAQEEYMDEDDED